MVPSLVRFASVLARVEEGCHPNPEVGPQIALAPPAQSPAGFTLPDTVHTADGSRESVTCGLREAFRTSPCTK